jgi:hypothetical protein
MDQYQIMRLISRIEPSDADLYEIQTYLVETLAEVSERLSDDQLKRLLICFACLYHRANGTKTEVDTVDQHAALRSRMQMN